MDTYTIPEAAVALGKSVPNFRRWVTGDLIPAPFLKDRERGYYCYSAEELRIIARVLHQHEQEFAYFCFKHETTSNVVHQSIMGYRNMHFGADPVDSTEDE